MKINPALRNRLKKRIVQELKNPSKRIVTVKSAVEMSEADLEALVSAVPQIKDAELQNVVDESIVGGLVIVDGSKIIDVSLKGKLDEIVATLLEN